MSNINDFIMENGVLKKYTGTDTDVVIPEGVISIGHSAFAWCTNLVSVTVPDSVTSIGDSAFAYCKNLTAITLSDSVATIGKCAFEECYGLCDKDGFVIVKDILFGYKGEDSCIVVPDGVTLIHARAFEGCQHIERIVLPAHTVTIEDSAFYGCSNLEHITMHASSLAVSDEKGLMFGSSGKTIEMTILRDDAEPLRTIGSFRKEYWAQKWNYKEDYLVPLTEKDLPNYDRLVATGDFEGFKMNEQGRLKAMAFRLAEKDRPVEAEYTTMFADFIAGKFAKYLKIAETENNPLYVIEAIKAGVITDDNRKKITNAIKKSAVDSIKILADQIDEIMFSEDLSSAEECYNNKIEQKYIDQLKKINAKAVLLKAGIEDIPQVIMADSKETAPEEYIRLILAEYISQYKKKSYTFAEIADEAAILLDKESLSDAIMGIYNNQTNQKLQQTYLPVIFRFVDGATAGRIYRSYKGIKWMEYTIDRCLVLSDTREAMMLADKYDLLDEYAKLRGTTKEYLQDTVIYDFGFNKDGKKYYNLGCKTVELVIDSNLNLAVFDIEKGKTVKSIPKKGVDEQLYAAANEDFSETKKNVKKAAKNKCDRLFEEFLAGVEQDADRWQTIYMTNPLLRQIANLLVWKQDKNTFIVKDKTSVDASGKEYIFNDKPIALAHPMEMTPEEVTIWQKYLVSNNLKQPFMQMWEPVVEGDSVKSDRYKDAMIPYYRFLNKERHGIIARDYNFHSDIEIEFTDCKSVVTRIDWRRHDIDINDRFEIESFGFGKYTRKVNHIVVYLDKVTVYNRIINDDISVETYLPQFTLAQITEFIKVATENDRKNVTALLLDYKNRKFADFDPMEEFSLDL